MLLLFGCLIACGLAVGSYRHADATIPPVKTGQQPWNIKGDLLILDVGSLSFQGNHPAFPPYSNPDSCRDTCMHTVGCSGWTFCSSSSGCGSGCAAYVKGNPQLTTAPNSNPTIPNPEWYKQPSVKSFGPWGLTSGCAFSCDSNGNCGKNDKWPKGMCSLKRVANPDKPEYWSQDAGEGWVSGWISVPKDCSGLSGRTCSRCLSSRDQGSCIKCSKSTLGDSGSMLASALTSGLTTADGCGSCFNLTESQRGKCTDCLYKDKACATCSLQVMEWSATAAQFDVTSCIDCTNKFGDTYSSACVNCGTLGSSAGNVKKCLACLDRAAKVSCSTNTWPPACWNPEQASSVCSACATDAKDFEACVKCVETKPFTESCYTCATLPDAAKQAKCYSCVKRAASAYTGCADCITYVSDSKKQDECISCLTNPKTTAEGKQWCFGCSNWCSALDAQAKCSQCLQKPSDNYLNACAC